MKGIFKNENVYVYLDTDKDPQCELKDEEAFIVGTSKFTQILYGGRVRVSYHLIYVKIQCKKAANGLCGGDCHIGAG